MSQRYTQLFCSLVFALITGVLWLICVALPGFSRKLMGLMQDCPSAAGFSFCMCWPFPWEPGPALRTFCW